MRKYRYIILGGGVAAGYAAGEFAERGVKRGELAIISAEPVVPYERPPLSKDFLQEDDLSLEDVQIHPPAFYRDNGIDLYLGTEIVEADLGRKALTGAEGQEFGYDRLLVATGTSALQPPIPGAESEKVLTLRDLSDAEHLRERARHFDSVMVIGGGFIALEAAASLVSRGIETTLVNAERQFMKHWFTPELSLFFERFLQRQGVHLEMGARVVSFSNAGAGVAAKLDSGKQIDVGFALAGVGVRTNTEFLNDDSVSSPDGVVVNEFLETSVSGVYAAGDLARFRDLLGNRWSRIEHWDNAVRQGRHAARVMTGLKQPYLQIPYFFSDVLELSYEYWGDPAQSDIVVTRGNVEDGSFSVWWLDQGRVTAAFVMDRPEAERRLAQLWVRQHREVPPGSLSDDGSDLSILESQDPTLYDGVLDVGRV